MGKAKKTSNYSKNKNPNNLIIKNSNNYILSKITDKLGMSPIAYSLILLAMIALICMFYADLFRFPFYSVIFLIIVGGVFDVGGFFTLILLIAVIIYVSKNKILNKVSKTLIYTIVILFTIIVLHNIGVSAVNESFGHWS